MNEAKKIKYQLTILIIFFLIYNIAIIYENNYWGNILSPVIAFSTSYFLIIISKKIDIYKNNWMLLALSCLSWGICDLLWGIYDLIFKINPENIDLFMYIYIIPNLFIISTVILYFIKNIKKLEYVQLIVDTTTTLILMLSFFWILILGEQFEFILSNIYELTTFLYIATDFISLSIIYIMFISIRSKKKSVTNILIVLGIIVYTISELLYVHQKLMGVYIPNSILDGLFMLTFILFAIAGAYKLLYEKQYIEESFNLPDNIDNNKKGRLILLIPLIMLFMLHKLDIQWIIFFTGIILIHKVLSSYVKISTYNKYMLDKEIEINDLLEKKIEERTKELIKANDRLKVLSQQDVLTNLYNRRYFMKKIDEMILTKKTDETIVVFYMDLNGFKIINDSYGHDMGDKVLLEVSNRLESFIPDDAILARLGGDEFIIARKGVWDLIEIQDFVEEMASLYEKPIIIEPYKFKVSFSVGIAMCAEDNLDRNTLIKNADVAMYYAKEDLNKMYVFYDKNLSRKVERKNKLELLLKNAVFDEEFEIHYQPQFNSNTKEIIGVEALIRWNSPLEGIISPVEFIPIAETCGIIVDIGYWVMKNAIKQVSYWNKYNNMNLRVAINVSPKQINSLDFIKNLKTIIQHNEIDPKLIDIEITENIELTQEGVIKEVLEELACIGVKISIDDFGTGYSSLSYIKRFHIDRLKIAKELVDNISSDSVNLKVVKAIIMIAKTMNIKTIAEGVEDEFQLQKLIELGCDEIQGYIWDKPLKIKEFEKKYLSKTGRVIDFL